MKLFDYVALKMKYNSLKNDYDCLVEMAEEDLFNSVLRNAEIEVQNRKLKAENKRLREKIKVLKEIIKNDKETM